MEKANKRAIVFYGLCVLGLAMSVMFRWIPTDIIVK